MAPVDIFQGYCAGSGRFAVALYLRNGAFNGVVAFLKAAHLLVKLFILLRKNPLNYGNILFAKNIAYLAQAHAKLLHISDYIKARGLLKSVIAVAALRVDISGLQ